MLADQDSDDGDAHDWLDRDAGPLVRPYAMTGGRVRPAAGLDLMTFVIAEPLTEPLGVRLQPEHRMILELAAQPQSVAEISSRLDLALGVVRVLIGDLLSEGLVALYEPDAAGYPPGETVLKAVIDGLQSL